MYKPKVIPTLLVGQTTAAQVHAVQVQTQTAPTTRLMTDVERAALNDAYLIDRAYRADGELV
jgi:hypothetical protein